MVAASEKWIEPNHKELSNKPWSRRQHHTLWTIFSWNLYVTIRSFPWRQQDSFDRFWNLSTTFITELYAMLCLFVMGLINSKGRVRLIRISQNEVLFLSLITTKCSWGVISQFRALFIPSRKSLLQFGQEENIPGHSFKRRVFKYITLLHIYFLHEH